MTLTSMTAARKTPPGGAGVAPVPRNFALLGSPLLRGRLERPSTRPRSELDYPETGETLDYRSIRS